MSFLTFILYHVRGRLRFAFSFCNQNTFDQCNQIFKCLTITPPSTPLLFLNHVMYCGVLYICALTVNLLINTSGGFSQPLQVDPLLLNSWSHVYSSAVVDRWAPVGSVTAAKTVMERHPSFYPQKYIRQQVHNKQWIVCTASKSMQILFTAKCWIIDMVIKLFSYRSHFSSYGCCGGNSGAFCY